MRYIDIAEAAFVDPLTQNTVSVKEIRPLDLGQAIQFILEVDSDFSLDEVASRADVYGRNTEGDAFKLFDANAVAIVDAQFDYTKVRRLRIPV